MTLKISPEMFRLFPQVISTHCPKAEGEANVGQSLEAEDKGSLGKCEESLWGGSVCCADSGQIYTSSSMPFKQDAESFPIAHVENKNHPRQSYEQLVCRTKLLVFL